MLEVADIHTYYGESHVLHGISLEVKPRSTVALLGRNGMGKTTVIHSIIGISPPRQGKVIIEGKDIVGLVSYQIARMGVALVPQGRRIFPSLSVRENLTMSSRGKNNSDSWTLDRVYSLFPVLKIRANLKGTQLSGGEQQMLAIGRALMTNPTLLLMDEPSEGLAPLIIVELERTIKQIHNSGVSILLVEQNLRLAIAVADYVYVISKGMIAYQSKPEELDKNEKVKEVYLGVAR